MTFETDVDLTRPAMLRGYVYSPEMPQQRWVLGLFLNNDLIGSYHAIDPIPHPFESDEKPFDCGFEINLSSSVFLHTDVFELRVLNTNHVLAALDIGKERFWRAPTEEDRLGFIRHAHGLTIAGVLDDTVTRHPSYEVLAWDGDEIVGRTRLYRWQHVGDGKNTLGKRVGFELLLNPKLADGEPHILRVETSAGQALPGSPVTILAQPNAFREACRAVARDDRSRMADMALVRLLENSVPFAAYPELFPELDAAGKSKAKLGKYRIFAHDSVTPMDTLAELLRDIDAPLVYFDMAVEARASRYPLLNPAFDYERQLEQGYASLLFAIRSDLFRTLPTVGATSAAHIFFQALERVDPRDILHVPHPGGICHEAQLASAKAEHMEALAEHLDRVGTNDVELWEQKDSTFPCVHVRRQPSSTRLSVIIPTFNQGQMLWHCVQSLRAQNSGIDLDVIVVDNRSNDQITERALDWVEATGGRVLEFAEGFNYARINTLAAKHAKADYLCFLNNDIAFTQSGVLHELLARLSDPTVGAVGPLMRRATDIIQHGGVVLGPHGGACHAFEDRMYRDPGYAELLRVAHECSAVTGALMVTPAKLFDAMGGFDARRFAVNFNDVDYCLRLRAEGYRVVFTPHCSVQHFESVSRGRENRSASANRMLREVQNLRERWGHVIRNDPFFHPQFSQDTLPYRALTSRPVPPRPRTNTIAPPCVLPDWV